jgi:hypothetical protein
MIIPTRIGFWRKRTCRLIPMRCETPDNQTIKESTILRCLAFLLLQANWTVGQAYSLQYESGRVYKCWMGYIYSSVAMLTPRSLRMRLDAHSIPLATT